MTENVPEIPIRLAKINGAVFINRDDVINLIQQTLDKASSLNSKSDLGGLIESLSEGIEDHEEV